MTKFLWIGVAIVFLCAACSKDSQRSTKSGNYYEELEEVLTQFQAEVEGEGDAEQAVLRLSEELDDLLANLSKLAPPAGTAAAHVSLLTATHGMRAAFKVTREGRATPTPIVPEPTRIPGGAIPAYRAACFDLEDLAASAGTVVELNCESPFGDPDADRPLPP